MSRTSAFPRVSFGRLAALTAVGATLSLSAGFAAADERAEAGKVWVTDFSGRPPFSRTLRDSEEVREAEAARTQDLASVESGRRNVPGKQRWTTRAAETAESEAVVFARFEEDPDAEPSARLFRGAPGKSFSRR